MEQNKNNRLYVKIEKLGFGVNKEKQTPFFKIGETFVNIKIGKNCPITLNLNAHKMLKVDGTLENHEFNGRVYWTLWVNSFENISTDLVNIKVNDFTPIDNLDEILPNKAEEKEENDWFK